MMKKVLAAVMSVAFLASFYPGFSSADTCPEVDAVKAMLKKERASSGDVSAHPADMMKAVKLVKEAEAACKAGKNDMAAEKVKAAMEMLRK
jgi:hypothetical protein